MGTPEFGAIILEGLIKSGHKPFLVVTAPDKPVGRNQIITSPPVKVLAEKYNIPVVQPDKIKNWKSEIENLKPDLGIIASFGKILPRDLLTVPHYGFINVHPSLLPKYRGPSPVQYAILNGDIKIGVTIMRVSELMDSGDILSQKEMEISKNEDFVSLHNKLAKLGTELLISAIPNLIAGRLPPLKQDESKATYTKILQKEDGRIDWEKTAESIERQVRAFSYWPGTFTFWKKSDKLIRIKILRTRTYSPINPNIVSKYPVGKVLVVPQNEIGIQTGKGLLVVEKLQPEGKEESNSEEFLRGHSDFIGTILR